MRGKRYLAVAVCIGVLTSVARGQEPSPVAAARDAARQAQNANNLKQIALALQNYVNVYRHFPPAVVTGKDGMTKYSWRVAILPFLESSPLHKEYHLDEPWDSENNKKLIEKMPEVFRSPYADPKSSNTAYFMLTGDGTIGGSEKGTTIRQIKDGLSYTIIVVEAKRDVPWTKPEDIEIDPDESKPLPKLGGFNQRGTFTAAFADGSVRQVDEKVDPAQLRLFFNMADGQVIDHSLMDTRIIGRKDEPTTQDGANGGLLQRLLGSQKPQLTARDQSANNLKEIGLAMLNYESEKRKMPPRAVFDKEGKPLLSWRVLILPYMEEAALYQQFHLDEPWDSEHNKALLAKMPKAYGDPQQKTDAGKTVYLAVVGKGFGFEGKEPLRLAAMLDGTSKTAAVVEASAENAVPWTKPDDWEPDENNLLKGLADTQPGGAFQVVFFDCHVDNIKRTIDPKILKSILTRNGGEPYGYDAIPRP
jgi:Protein of unknown function (DUF1559)